MVSEHERRELYEAAEQAWGPAPAATLMELLPPAGWGDLVRASDLALFRGELRSEMAELRGELKGEMAELRSELKGEMAELRSELKGEMAELRGQLPKLIAANIASMIGVSGLVLAAASLA